MDELIEKLAQSLGAKHVAEIPDVGPGAFGAARLRAIVRTLHSSLEPSRGLRPGRPTNPNWTRHPKVPMSDDSQRKLELLAEQASTKDRKVSPMQVAAQLLEESLARITN